MTHEIGVTYPYSYSTPNENIGFWKAGVSEIRQAIAPFRFSLAASGIVKELGIIQESKVLELGCGLGLLGEAIKERVGTDLTYIGVDLVFNSAKECGSKGIMSTQTDITNLPIQSGSIDFVVTTDVLEHVPDAKSVFSEIKRVLKPNGKGFIVIADPSEGRFSNVEGHINRDGGASNVLYWERIIKESSLTLSPNSKKYRNRDWRKIFNLPLLVKLKDKPGFACAFNPINRPGVYIVQK